MSSRVLVAELNADPEGPWCEWKGGKPLTQKQLAGLLRGFGIISTTVHPAGEPDAKGYRRADFEDLWRRYLPSETSKRPNPDEMGTYDTFSSVRAEPSGRIKNSKLSLRKREFGRLDGSKA